MMPCDSLLNQDLRMSNEARAPLTANLEEDCKGKFIMTNPLRGAHADHRNMELTTGNVPSSKRIASDVEKIFESMIIIQKTKGDRCTRPWESERSWQNAQSGREKRWRSSKVETTEEVSVE